MEVHEGDVIEVPGNKVGQPTRRGDVEAVQAQDPLRLLVRWEDGHTSVFHPAGGTLRVVAGSTSES